MTAQRSVIHRLALAFVTVSATLIVLALAYGAARGADVDQVLGRMRQAVTPGKDMRGTVQFTMLNPKGESVVWAGQVYRRSGPDGRMRLVFDSPLDMRGTEITVSRDPEGASHTRVYLPSIRRSRDITGDMRGESFLGTDFNYEDLGIQQLDYQQHALRGDEDVDGKSCWEVESVAARGWWYGKVVRCIDKKTYLPIRTEYYDRGGVLWKVRTFEEIKKIDGYPTATQVTMQTVPTGTLTRITLSDVAYDTGLRDSLFDGP